MRLRPGLIFKRSAATEIRRLFIGPLLPPGLLRAGLIPVCPDVPRLLFQAVHSDDVGGAYRRAVLSDVRGPFNIAAEPVIGGPEMASMLDARRVPVPARVLPGVAAATFALALKPAEPGWVDMAIGVPLMDISRAREKLAWTPTHSATDALTELMGGMRDGADESTPRLAAGTSGPFRVTELVTGMTQRP